MPHPRTITTILFDGKPRGTRQVSLSNRPIVGIAISRADMWDSDLRELLSGKSGVYFLVWESEEAEEEILRVYIGQSTDCFDRLKSHVRQKEFWTTAIFFFTRENSLDSTKINFLEKELIARSQKAGRAEIHENMTSGNRGNADLSVRAEMEDYLEDLELLVAHLGYPLLSPVHRSGKAQEKRYLLSLRGSRAIGISTEEWFVVLAGSTGPWEMAEHVIKRRFYAYRNRPKLLQSGIIEEREDSIVFLKDHLFRSPGSAADLVTGGSCDGWTCWKDKDCKTLGENERRTLGEV